MNKNDIKDELEYRELENDMKLLEREHFKLVNDRGIILLDHMDDDRLKRVRSLLKEFPDLRGYTVLEGDEKRLVLKYLSNYLVEDVNAHNEYAYEAYKAKDYDTAIEEYKTVLCGTLYSKAYVYDMIGRCYLAKGERDNAIPYLIVATYNSSKENGKRRIDHSKLIVEYLNRKFNMKASNEGVFSDKSIMKHKELMYNEEYDFGIKNIDVIRDYAAINDMSIEEVGAKLGLPNETRDLIKLICARDLYKQGMIEEGNKFLNEVDGTKNKTPLVYTFLKQVRERKRFYQYRGEKPKTLIYLRPGKREY